MPFGGPKGGKVVNPLPRLNNVVLSGVHVHWPLLPQILPCPMETRGMRTLELSYHCDEVRPTVSEFRAIVERCPNLFSLRVNVSGPTYWLEDVNQEDGYRRTDHRDPVALPHLHKLFLGWHDSFVSIEVMNTISAPNVRRLVLQDSVHFTSADEGADELLTYVGTGRTADRPDVSHAVFPLLESVTLRNVRGTDDAFDAFFEHLYKLKKLTLVNTSIKAHSALIPHLRAGDAEKPVKERRLVLPCPALELLTVNGYDQARHSLLATLPALRMAGKGPAIAIMTDSSINYEESVKLPSASLERFLREGILTEEELEQMLAEADEDDDPLWEY